MTFKELEVENSRRAQQINSLHFDNQNLKSQLNYTIIYYNVSLILSWILIIYLLLRK